jgi:hypothetical protein
MKNKIFLVVIIATLMFLAEISIKNCAAQNLPVEGIGCWVQQDSINNPLIYSDIFGWYITHGSNFKDFVNKKNKPLFLAFGGKDADNLIDGMKQYRDRIKGVVWDYESRGNPQHIAEKNLKEAYSAAQQLGLLFGVVVKPEPDRSLNVNGISYTNAASFSDFLMPMMYVQWYQMKREKLEKLLELQRAESKLPLIALIALETTETKPPRKLEPHEIVNIYRGLPIDAFCVWNVKDLNDDHIRALSKLKK